VKYLIIAAVVALAFVVVYSRVRPYLLLIRKVVNSLNASVTVGNVTPTSDRSVENKLVKCAGCETWIPEDRALNLRKGNAVYCSPECLEKQADPRSQISDLRSISNRK
jgi:hypothetical protein